MAKHTRQETIDYVAKILKGKPDTAYAEIVTVAKGDGHHVYPLIMGKAKNQLGMGRPKKAKRGPGRPAVAAQTAPQVPLDVARVGLRKWADSGTSCVG